jgi:Xaa-Pro aminopeptidase
MKSFFSADFFAGNRQKLLASSSAELIVVTANGLLQRSQDTAFLFRQDSYFWYLCGLNDPDLILVLQPNEKKEFIILPEKSEYQAIFDGVTEPSVYAKTSGITDILAHYDGWERLAGLAKKAKTVHILGAPAARIDQQGMYTNPARQFVKNELLAQAENAVFEDIRPAIMQLRQVKQAPELAALQAAIDITVASFAETQPLLDGMTHEYEFEAAMTAGFRKRGAYGHAYEPIVAGGKHACILHNISNNKKLKTGNVLLCDIGAEVEWYAADITRTYFYKAKPTDRQRAVYDAVLAVQDMAIAMLKPGVSLKAYEEAVSLEMSHHLKRLGLITRADRESVKYYFPHATSHFLGLDVHDVADYERLLEPGMVLTVEPGIYIAEEGIGIRTEDDILITEKGNTVLSKALQSGL